MSLTSNDLMQFKGLLQEVVNPILGEIEALWNDIKEIYEMIEGL